MKIIRNDVCYIELEDLSFSEPLPQIVFCELKVYYSKDIKFQKFTKEEAVNFFRRNEYIIDYDSVKELSEGQLEYKIREIKEKLNHHSAKWLNGSQVERKKLDMDKEYNSLIKNLSYILQTLENYKNNKISYDKEITEIFNKKQKRL